MFSVLKRGKGFGLGLLLAVLLGSLVAGTVTVSADGGSGELPVIWFFWGEGCPYCALEAEFLDELKERYPELTIRSLEVFSNPANRILMQRMAFERGEVVQAVPVTIIGDELWVGFNQVIAQAIESALRQGGEEHPDASSDARNDAGDSQAASQPSAAGDGSTTGAVPKADLGQPLLSVFSV